MWLQRDFSVYLVNVRTKLAQVLSLLNQIVFSVFRASGFLDDWILPSHDHVKNYSNSSFGIFLRKRTSLQFRAPSRAVVRVTLSFEAELHIKWLIVVQQVHDCNDSKSVWLLQVRQIYVFCCNKHTEWQQTWYFRTKPYAMKGTQTIFFRRWCKKSANIGLRYRSGIEGSAEAGRWVAYSRICADALFVPGNHKHFGRPFLLVWVSLSESRTICRIEMPRR